MGQQFGYLSDQVTQNAVSFSDVGCYFWQIYFCGLIYDTVSVSDFHLKILLFKDLFLNHQMQCVSYAI